MLSLEKRLQLYQNFVNNTENDIKYREEQNKLREKAINRILIRLKKCPNDDKDKLLKILSNYL